MIQFLAALAILHQDGLKKRTNLTYLRNGCFEKMYDELVHTAPNHHPSKMDVLPKLFFKTSLLRNGMCGILSMSVR